VTRKNKATLLAAAAVLTASVAWASQGTAPQDALAGPPVAVTLVQAIEAAQLHHAGSHATRAERRSGRGGDVAYDVEVVAGTQTFDVKVDARTGALISSVEDHDDANDDDKDDERD